MEGNENSGLSSYYHHHHHQNATGTTATSGTNGIFSNPHHHQHHQQQQQHHHQHHQHNPSSGHYSSSEPTPLVFPPHSVTGRAPPLTSSPPQPPPETVRRKRGRPRKYGTSEAPQTSSANKKGLPSSTSSPSTSLPLPSSPRKKEPSSVSSPSSSKKSQLAALGNAGQGFTPHVITVAAGEDVAQKIMSFMQQRKRAICILSASGSISNASLRQPATLGGNVTYEVPAVYEFVALLLRRNEKTREDRSWYNNKGRFEILSLSGSFLHTEIGGASSRTGGLSVCLSGTDGRIVGGGVGGPLKAAGPVQVIVGSFVFDTKKDADIKVETSASKLPPAVVGATVSSVSFRSTLDPSGRTSVRGNDDHQHIGGSSFMLQSRGMHVMPSGSTDWRRELTGSTDLGACQSPEDGDDEQLRD